MSHKDQLSNIAKSGATPATYQRMFTPENMLTVIQKTPRENVGAYANLLGCSRSTALNLINQLIKDGLVEKKTKEVGASKKIFVSYVPVVVEKKVE